jgi:hypothetical protein
MTPNSLDTYRRILALPLDHPDLLRARHADIDPLSPDTAQQVKARYKAAHIARLVEGYLDDSEARQVSNRRKLTAKVKQAQKPGQTVFDEWQFQMLIGARPRVDVQERASKPLSRAPYSVGSRAPIPFGRTEKSA